MLRRTPARPLQRTPATPGAAEQGVRR
jgi:hypothetical protein